MRNLKLSKSVLLTASLVALIAGCAKKDAEKVAQEEAAEGIVEALEARVEDANITKAAQEALAADNLKAAKAFLETNALKDQTVVLPNGLQYEVLEKGPEGGISPQEGDQIDMEYKWIRLDGTVFESSERRGSAARASFDERLSQGVFEGMALMSTGDRYRFTLPPELAFGESGVGDGDIIGPNEGLIFEVKLIQIVNPQANAAAAIEFLKANGTKPGIKTTSTGLQYEILEEGPSGGKSPTASDGVKVHYRGTLINGSEFDSSYARQSPSEFGVGQVIDGWTEGLQLMSEGDKYRFFIPPELAYGESGRPPSISQNEMLIFEVELLEVK